MPGENSPPKKTISAGPGTLFIAQYIFEYTESKVFFKYLMPLSQRPALLISEIAFHQKIIEIDHTDARKKKWLQFIMETKDTVKGYVMAGTRGG